MISEVARRYAKALYDSAIEQNKAEVVFEELRAIETALQADANLLSFFKSPVVPAQEKSASFKAALTGKVSESILGFFQLLIEKGRSDILDEVLQAFEGISDAAHGVTRGIVRSASPLSTQSAQKLETAIFAVTKKKVILKYSEEPALLGGMVATVGGWTFDDSLKSHLHRMSDQLSKNF